MKNIAPLLRYLRARDHISDEEAGAIENLSWRVKTFAHNEIIIRQGSVMEESCLLMDGFAARSEAMAGGRGRSRRCTSRATFWTCIAFS